MTMMNNGEGGTYEAKKGDPWGNWQRCRDSRSPFGGGGLLSDETEERLRVDAVVGTWTTPRANAMRARAEVETLKSLRSTAERIALGVDVPYTECPHRDIGGCRSTCGECGGSGRVVDDSRIESARRNASSGGYSREIDRLRAWADEQDETAKRNRRTIEASTDTAAKRRLVELDEIHRRNGW